MFSFNTLLAQQIVKLRRRSGMSQIEVSETAGVSFRTYQRIESGEISPRTNVIITILRVLNADVSKVCIKSTNFRKLKNMITTSFFRRYHLSNKKRLI